MTGAINRLLVVGLVGGGIAAAQSCSNPAQTLSATYYPYISRGASGGWVNEATNAGALGGTKQ